MLICFVLSGKDENQLHETSLHSVISVVVSGLYMNIFHIKFCG